MEQRSPEWHKARANRITGSIAGAFLGNSPYMTPEQAIRSMVRAYHGAESEFAGGPHIDYGNANEDGAQWQFEMESGLTVDKCGFFPYEDCFGASPDGLIGDDIILEIKCPYSRRNGGEFKPLSDQPHYHDQIQMELLATGRAKAIFYQWSPHDTMTEYVNASQEWRDECLPILRQQYALYLSELDNPEHLEPLRVELNTQETKRLVDEYDQLSEAIGNAKERQSEVLDALIEASKGKNALLWGKKLTKVTRAGSVSYAKAIEDIAPDADLEKYRGKPSEYWKFG